LQQRSFDFLGELRETGASERLKQKIKQEDLSPDQKQFIHKNLLQQNFAHATRLFRLCEMAINFLQSTGDASMVLGHAAEERLFIDYLRDDLQIKADDDSTIKHLFGGNASGTSGSSGSSKLVIKLKHLDSLWRTLEAGLTQDIFAEISPAYKKPLPQSIVNTKLNAEVMSKLDLQCFMKAFLEFIRNNLTEQQMNVNGSVKEYIGYLEVVVNSSSGKAEETYLSNLPWFVKHFPADITMNYCCSLYQVMDSFMSQQLQK